jgi:hypothetical protein
MGSLLIESGKTAKNSACKSVQKTAGAGPDYRWATWATWLRTPGFSSFRGPPPAREKAPSNISTIVFQKILPAALKIVEFFSYDAKNRLNIRLRHYKSSKFLLAVGHNCEH